jgi:hypothetical protein
MASGAVASAMPLPALAGASTRGAHNVLDLTSPEGRLRALIMIRGALDERLVCSWVAARYHGVVDDRIEPLFSVVSAGFARFRARDGGYDAVTAELAWFTDSTTGDVLDTYDNPLNGKTVKVPTGGLGASQIRFGSDLSFELARKVPGLSIAHEVLPIRLQGDEVWLTERTRTEMALPGATRPFRYAETNTFHTRLSALSVANARQVTSEVSFTNVCSWRPWLEMADHPGHLMATGAGKQGVALDALPEDWMRATAARRPEVLKDPGALLAPFWNALER